MYRYIYLYYLYFFFFNFFRGGVGKVQISQETFRSTTPLFHVQKCKKKYSHTTQVMPISLVQWQEKKKTPFFLLRNPLRLKITQSTQSFPRFLQSLKIFFQSILKLILIFKQVKSTVALAKIEAGKSTSSTSSHFPNLLQQPVMFYFKTLRLQCNTPMFCLRKLESKERL